MKQRFDLAAVAALSTQTPGDILLILLREATNFVECESLDQAAWRLADASLLLRQRMAGVNNVLGLDVPTGRGALIGGHKHRGPQTVCSPSRT
jgi:hypothetical protein